MFLVKGTQNKAMTHNKLKAISHKYPGHAKSSFQSNIHQVSVLKEQWKNFSTQKYLTNAPFLVSSTVEFKLFHVQANSRWSRYDHTAS